VVALARCLRINGIGDVDVDVDNVDDGGDDDDTRYENEFTACG